MTDIKIIVSFVDWVWLGSHSQMQHRSVKTILSIAEHAKIIFESHQNGFPTSQSTFPHRTVYFHPRPSAFTTTQFLYQKWFFVFRLSLCVNSWNEPLEWIENGTWNEMNLEFVSDYDNIVYVTAFEITVGFPFLWHQSLFKDFLTQNHSNSNKIR